MKTCDRNITNIIFSSKHQMIKRKLIQYRFKSLVKLVVQSNDLNLSNWKLEIWSKVRDKLKTCEYEEFQIHIKS